MLASGIDTENMNSDVDGIFSYSLAAAPTECFDFYDSQLLDFVTSNASETDIRIKQVDRPQLSR